jgi:hypoxanthine-guanine phosphoribosyltransferase
MPHELKFLNTDSVYSIFNRRLSFPISLLANQRIYIKNLARALMLKDAMDFVMLASYHESNNPKFV